LVNEAAASTVGPLPAALEAVLDPPLDPAPDACEVVLLLLPHPASASATVAPIAKTAADARRSRVALNVARSLSTSCQNPGSIP
jgi:hypothetical protein